MLLIYLSLSVRILKYIRSLIDHWFFLGPISWKIIISHSEWIWDSGHPQTVHLLKKKIFVFVVQINKCFVEYSYILRNIRWFAPRIRFFSVLQLPIFYQPTVFGSRETIKQYSVERMWNKFGNLISQQTMLITFHEIDPWIISSSFRDFSIHKNIIFYFNRLKSSVYL